MFTFIFPNVIGKVPTALIFIHTNYLHIYILVFSLSFNQIFQLLTNITISTDAKSNSPIAVDSTEFAQCVENISVLNLRLKNSEERCQLLRADLRQAKQVSIELMQSKLHPKLYIPSSINTTDFILWHLQLIVCALAYFDLKKYSC